jgi:hypothetical protein
MLGPNYSSFVKVDIFTSPDITCAAIRANTVRRTIHCPMRGKSFQLPHDLLSR